MLVLDQTGTGANGTGLVRGCRRNLRLRGATGRGLKGIYVYESGPVEDMTPDTLVHADLKPEHVMHDAPAERSPLCWTGATSLGLTPILNGRHRAVCRRRRPRPCWMPAAERQCAAGRSRGRAPRRRAIAVRPRRLESPSIWTGFAITARTQDRPGTLECKGTAANRIGGALLARV